MRKWAWGLVLEELGVAWAPWCGGKRGGRMVAILGVFQGGANRLCPWPGCETWEKGESGWPWSF